VGDRADGGGPGPVQGVRWGVIHVRTGRWVAFGSEARCRALVAHLTAVNALLHGPGGTGAAGGRARR